MAVELTDNRFELPGSVGLERRWLMGIMRRWRPDAESSVSWSPAALAVSAVP